MIIILMRDAAESDVEKIATLLELHRIELRQLLHTTPTETNSSLCAGGASE